jgi:DNA gyrase subunit A
VPEDTENKFRMFATSMGTIRRNDFSDFESIRANGKIAMKLEPGESLVSVSLCDESQDVFISTYRGRCIRFPVTEIRVFQSRNSVGVRALKLGKDDSIIGMAMLSGVKEDPATRAAYIKQSRALRRAEGLEEEEKEQEKDDDLVDTGLVLDEAKIAQMAAREQFILTISENGFGKRTSAYEYRTTHRGGMGFTNIKLGGKNTAVAGSFPIDADHDIMMVTDGGKIIRTPVAMVRIAGRSTAGVTLFKTAADEKVISATAIEKEEEGESEGEGE